MNRDYRLPKVYPSTVEGIISNADHDENLRRDTLDEARLELMAENKFAIGGASAFLPEILARFAYNPAKIFIYGGIAMAYALKRAGQEEQYWRGSDEESKHRMVPISELREANQRIEELRSDNAFLEDLVKHYESDPDISAIKAAQIDANDEEIMAGLEFQRTLYSKVVQRAVIERTNSTSAYAPEVKPREYTFEEEDTREVLRTRDVSWHDPNDFEDPL